jgi:hypothetical protein
MSFMTLTRPRTRVFAHTGTSHVLLSQARQTATKFQQGSTPGLDRRARQQGDWKIISRSSWAEERGAGGVDERRHVSSSSYDMHVSSSYDMEAAATRRRKSPPPSTVPSTSSADLRTLKYALSTSSPAAQRSALAFPSVTPATGF